MKLIRADWQAPDHIHALTTTRLDGYSHAPFASLNLGTHVGDDPEAVAQNRQILLQALGLMDMKCWLISKEICNTLSCLSCMEDLI